MYWLSTGVLFGVVAMSAVIVVLFVSGTRIVVQRMGGRNDATTMAASGRPYTIPTASGAMLRQFAWSIAIMGLLAVATAIILVRFTFGIGSVTNLENTFPWGLWIGFDVMSGVALAAGAFVIAGTAHILGMHRFEPLVKPAILTGLLGYLLVIAGLVVDLGRPYNVWRPLVHWQHHSPLWEVGCCVAIYTTVLIIEFSPTMLKPVSEYQPVASRLPVRPVLRFLTKFAIVFVILGVVLSTLHQSSLGSLWTLVPTKLHSLWYTVYLPVFFWISAVAAGLAMTIVESTLSSKAFHRGLESHLLQDLGKAAAVVLAIYLVARSAELYARGDWVLLLQPTLPAVAYWMEIGLGILTPILIFTIRPLRNRPWVLFTGAMMVVVFGIVLNRLNVSIVGLWDSSGVFYRPTWMEFAVSAALVTAGVLVFGLAAKYLPVFPPEEEEAGAAGAAD